MATALSPGDWTDSSEDSDDSRGPTSVSSEEELGPFRRAKKPIVSRYTEKRDSASQTSLSGLVCYQSCYVGKSVTHHSETFKVDRGNGTERGPIGRTMRDVSCQTKSTGTVRTKEEIDRLRLLPSPLPRQARQPEGNNIETRLGMCDRSTLVRLITNALPTLPTEMLSALSAVVFNVVDCRTDWDAIEARFGIEVDSREVSEVGCNTDPPVLVDRGAQTAKVLQVAVSHKCTQAKAKTASKGTLVRFPSIDKEDKRVETKPVVACVDVGIQADILVTRSHRGTQTLPSYLQSIYSLFHLSPLGLCILVLSSVHVFEVMKNLIFE